MDIAKSGEELVHICEENSISLSEYAIIREMEDRDISREEVFLKMKKTLEVMRVGAAEAREKEIYSVSGL
ncbi:L-serine ammonia-lyase, iron-sulfur-dependent, subunit alpha, partial [Clostridium perfringens]|nr:L-serine ammonia-lyase, iron-sulfur-dependent, subunit alpha [Clostridium perfringens]